MYEVYYISGKGKRYLYKTFATKDEAISFVNVYQETHKHRFYLQIAKRPEAKK